MKTCFKCEKSKPLTAFYAHPYMADGRLNKCKDCAKADVTAHRKQNLEKIKEYDRARGQTQKRKQANRRRYRVRISTKIGRKREWQRSKEWREKHQISRAAHLITAAAIKKGSLVKLPCERCGSKTRIHGHHEDYLKPLDVTWLCRKCHGERHREINEERRNNI